MVFTCNHCPYAKKYEDRINALNKKYKKEGYPVIAINANDSMQEPEDSYTNMQVRAKEKGFTYVLDSSQTALLVSPPADDLIAPVKAKLGLGAGAPAAGTK